MILATVYLPRLLRFGKKNPFHINISTNKRGIGKYNPQESSLNKYHSMINEHHLMIIISLGELIVYNL